MQADGNQGCGHQFELPIKPRDTCNREIEARCQEHPQRCYWHCACQVIANEKRFGPPLKERLETDAAADLYFEGIHLDYAKLPGAELPKVMLAKSSLRGAILTDGQLAAANLCGTDLRDAHLERARLKRAGLREARLDGVYLQEADLRHADLGGGLTVQDALLADADLRGAYLEHAHLQGSGLLRIRLDRWTRCETTEWGTPRDAFEVAESAEGRPREITRWLCQKAVFQLLREHYRETGNHEREDHFAVREARCRHLALPGWKRWTTWKIHQILWGYGVMPWLLLGWMAAVVLLFGVAVFPRVGIADGYSVCHQVWQGVALSLVTFATLGYGNLHPASIGGEVWAGVESILAMVFVSMFVVSLARKYVRW